MRKLIVLAVATCMYGCQTWGPSWSELSGQRFTLTSSALEVGPTIISQVDGYTPSGGPLQPVKISPGQHKVVLQAVPPGSVTGIINLEEMVFDAKPCVRYYVNARFKTATSTAWTPFVDYEEKIAGCQIPAAGTTK